MTALRDRPSASLDIPARGSAEREKAAFIGISPAFRQLVRTIDRVAPTEHALLIFGATGSGKELVARRLHERGLNRDQPFVDLNCGAIPEDLVEAELFGHVRGAFTGAVENRRGLLQQAGKGTLFLDEIGELPLSLQPKLLRALETRTYRPVGSSANLQFEGRIIAATHRNLREAVREGRFREDLFYRLAVFILHVPNLEQRGEDIPALLAHFAAQQTRNIEFTPAAIKRLSEQSWPGNIRQLRNLVSQLCVLTEHERVDADMLEPFLAAESSDAGSLTKLADQLLDLDGDDKLAAAESLLIDRALERTAYNKSAAATLLGVGRKVVERRLKAREERHREARQCLERADAFIGAAQFQEAVPLLRRSLELLQQGSQEEDSRRLQFAAYRSLAVALRTIHGWLHAEAMACYTAALTVGAGVCDGIELATVQFGLWTTQLVTLHLTQARATAQDLLQRVHGIDSQAALDEAHVALANTLFWLGDSEEALATLARGGLRHIGSADRRIGVQGLDLAGLALTFEGLAAFQIGAVDEARRAMDTLITRTEEGHSHLLGYAIDLQGAVWLAMLFNDIERLGVLASELDSVSAVGGFAFYRGVGQVFRACYLSAAGLLDEAEQLLIDGYENYMVKQGGALFFSFKTWQHCEILLRSGRARECEALISASLDEVIQRQERVYLGELLIVKARAQWALGDITAAEQGLRSAISTALALGSVPARLSAATYLADLLRQSGRKAQAVEALERALRMPAAVNLSPAAQRASGMLAELRADDLLNPQQPG